MAATGFEVRLIVMIAAMIIAIIIVRKIIRRKSNCKTHRHRHNMKRFKICIRIDDKSSCQGGVRSVCRRFSL